MQRHSVILYRIHQAKNMRRYYRLDVQRDLFGNHCLLRMWGRMGKPGQMRSIPYPTSDEAQTAFHKQRATKERRRYTAYTTSN